MFIRNFYSEIAYIDRWRMQSLRTKVIPSDESSEDKGYDPSHRHTKKGKLAYANGESPKTYLTKKYMLREIKEGMQELKTSWENGGGSLAKLEPKPCKILSFLFENPIEETIKKLGKEFTKEELFHNFYIFSGFHYTGKYYKYTRFYKMLEGEDLLIKLLKVLYKPTQYQQTKLLQHTLL